MTSKLFDHLAAIYTNQAIDYFDSLDDADKKTYEPYMINRFISMNPHHIMLANEMNKYYGVIDAKSSYLFYSQIVPKGKQFNKYVKAEKSEKFPEWLLEVIQTYCEISMHEAITYAALCMETELGKVSLRKMCKSMAIEDKQLKKAGL